MNTVNTVKWVPSARPFDEGKFRRTLKLLNDGVAEIVAPGMALALWQRKDPEIFQFACAGVKRLDQNPPSPIDLDTVFDLASLTKVLATTSLTMVAIQKGLLNLSTRVKNIFPEFLSNEVTVAHLLSHTAGYSAWNPFYEKLRASLGSEKLWSFSFSDRQNRMRKSVFEFPFEIEVDQRALYSDLSFLVLGFVLEEVFGCALDHACKKWVFEPLGIPGLHFVRVNAPVNQVQNPAAAATESCPWRGGVLQGQVHDDNTWAMGGVAGHAGLFGKLSEVISFIPALQRGFVDRKLLEHFWNRYLGVPKCERALGWDTPTLGASSSGKYFPARSIGHLGYTGTSIWHDRDSDLTIVLLTNRVHPTRENQLIKKFRPLIHDTLREEILA